MRSHDQHREWATDKITEHERLISVAQSHQETIMEDVREIKNALNLHLDTEVKFQMAMIKKFGITVE